VAYTQLLLKELSPAQVRCALTAVIKKVTDAKEIFDDKGGCGLAYGHQPLWLNVYFDR